GSNDPVASTDPEFCEEPFFLFVLFLVVFFSGLQRPSACSALPLELRRSRLAPRGMTVPVTRRAAPRPAGRDRRAAPESSSPLHSRGRARRGSRRTSTGRSRRHRTGTA